MKKYLLIMAIGTLVLALACRKDPIHHQPEDPPPADTVLLRSYRFVFDDLPGVAAGRNDLSAVVTIINDQNERVLDRKFLPLSYDGKYRTVELKLIKGNYKIAGMIIVKADSTALLASPIRGSAKAAAVTQPLNVPFSLNEKIVQELSTELLPVSAADKAVDFGYPAGSFGEKTPGQDPLNDVQIIVHPIIKVGNVIYDSIPVMLTIKTFDANNNMIFRNVPLAAGKQPILLSRDGVRYELTVSKWGVTDELKLSKRDIVENTVYTLGGEAVAKKLKSVITSKITNGVSKPESKADFEYNAAGDLTQILYYAKKPDMTTYLSHKEEFSYSNGHISEVKLYDENGALKTITRFQYNPQGKVVKMEENDNGILTTGDVFYTAIDGSTGISGNYRIDITYKSTGYYYTINFNKIVTGGVVISDVLATTHGDYQQGMYEYDFNINPYCVLELPTVSFSHYSKHNTVGQFRTYNNAYPTVVPYDFAYSYSNDGFPKESHIKYKTYFTQADAYTIRTVFEYY